MLSLEDCKKILNKNGKIKYTDEEVATIRKCLYELVNIQLEIQKELFKDWQPRELE